MRAIRVCIADDHSLVRRGLRLLLNTDSRMEVVGEVSTIEETLAVVVQVEPDVLLLDLSMPGGDFETLIRSLSRDVPRTRIVVLTMHDNIEYAKTALRAGATSYLTKGIAESELISSIVAVVEGRSVVNLRTDAGLVDLLTQKPTPASRVAAPHIKVLSQRESEVLKLVTQGFTSSQIAEKLFLSVKTVDTYRSRLMTKLELKTRAELVKYGVAQGWFNEERGGE